MIVKRKLYSDSSKEKSKKKSKKAIRVGTSASLGALGGLGITKTLSKDNLGKLANKVGYKKIAGDKVSGLSEYYLSRGPVAEKIAEVVGSEKLAKAIKSKKGIIIGTTALGAGLLGLKKNKEKEA